jgi:hypothetical protein
MPWPMRLPGGVLFSVVGEDTWKIMSYPTWNRKL